MWGWMWLACAPGQGPDPQAVTALSEWLADPTADEVTREDIVSVVDPAASIQLAADVFNGFGGVLANAFLIFLTAVFILFETSTFPTKLRAMVDRPEQSMAEFAEKKTPTSSTGPS